MSHLLDLLEKFERCSGYKKITTRNQKKRGRENGKTENTLRSMLRNIISMKNWMFWKRPYTIGRDGN